MVEFFFFKQKTAYEMRISDWSSDVCSSDLRVVPVRRNILKWMAVAGGGPLEQQAVYQDAGLAVLDLDYIEIRVAADRLLDGGLGILFGEWLIAADAQPAGPAVGVARLVEDDGAGIG